MVLGKTDYPFSFLTTRCLDLFGISLDNELNFKDHISSVCKKINNQFSVFKRFGKLISSEIMLRLYKAFILPHFHYCSMIWHFCNSEDSVKLDTLRAILQESEAKLKMKIFNPSSIFVWIGRCIVAMVTTLDHVGQTSMF